MTPGANELPVGRRISVCMATYNGERFLAEQVESILSQLAPGDELVVSDDGSTDATVEVLQRFTPALRLVSCERAGGVVMNFSRAMEAATGDFILLADQDDVWLPGRVEVFRQALIEVDLVLTNALVVDEDLRPTGATLFDQIRPSLGFWRNLSRRNSFVGCCIGFRRALAARALPLPLGTPWHDWLIGLLACLTGRTRQIDQPLLLYRRHGSNASLTGEASANGLLRKARLRWQVLRALATCLRRPVPASRRSA